MKKLDFLKTLVMVLFFSIGINHATAQDTLAIWTFEEWPGGTAPEGQDLYEPIFADAGVSSANAQLGTEFMFPDSGGEEEDIRRWSVPSGPGYIRAQSMVEGTYFRVIGISTLGYDVVKFSANLGTDSSSRPYYVQLQYRIGSSDDWINVGAEALVSSTSTSTMEWVYDNHELPAECGNVEELEFRILVTFLLGENAQGRISGLIVTGSDISSNINDSQINNIKVSGSNGELQINGAGGSDVSVYSLTGVKVLEAINISDSEVISLPSRQVYIIKVGQSSFKVIL